MGHEQVFWLFSSTAAVLALLVLSVLAYSKMRSDDEQVGEAIVPLHLLMDQQKHTLLLTLRPPLTESGAPAHDKRNEHGGLGILRLRLEMSER